MYIFITTVRNSNAINKGKKIVIIKKKKNRKVKKKCDSISLLVLIKFVLFKFMIIHLKSRIQKIQINR